MPSYLELNKEAVWRAQFVPAALQNVLVTPLQAFYGLGPNLIGSPGDNNHLQGRHRSAEWDRLSRYSTSRTYGTTDTRDRRGNQSWYRAIDIGVSGPTQWASCRRLDAAVRAGLVPGVAEWFGTFDGNTVVGWFEGHASSSDSSHLSHTHIGIWNESANDPVLMKKLYELVVGVPATTGDEMIIFCKDADGNFYKCNGITCIPVPAAEIENQTYVYAGLNEWAPVGEKANAVGPSYYPAQPIPGVPGHTSYLKIYDGPGFFGVVAAPTPPPAGGVTLAQVKAEIAGSTILPPV